MKLALVTALLVACSSGSTKPPPPAAATTEDHVVVLAHHKPAKPTDPVAVRFAKFRVTKTHFDPAHLEGGTATLELDVASLASGSSERDDDLRSFAFLDVLKFTTATIDIAHVTHTANATYAADATVTFHGATRTYPVTFTVVDTQPDHIKITGEHTFSRLDFSVGTDPATDPQQQVDTPLTIQLALTLPVKV